MSILLYIPVLYIPVFIFIFGLCVGSFLNCVVYRLEEGKGFTKSRSFCPKCKHKLRVWDLIPVLSFVFLRGRCRYCNAKISWQYPLVEIATGLLLILNFKFLILNQFLIFNFQTLIYSLYLLLITCLLFLIFIYDLKHYIIPDKVVYPAIGIAFLYQLFGNWKLEIGNWKPFLIILFTAVSVSAFFFAIWFASRGRWMGFGDVKLSFFMGLFLGFPKILVALFSAFSIGAVVGIALILLGKKKLKSEVPFGPFLVAGTFLALLWGKEIINWYLNFLT